MATAVLHIENNIYFQINIENTEFPPTSNLINKIIIQEGISSIPVMQLHFNDTGYRLSRELALTEGTLATIMLGKDNKDIKTKQFRLFGHRQGQSQAGPEIIALFILNSPEFITGSIREGYQGTTDSVMQQLTEKSGIKYDGPGGTNDSQIWLNICQTRLSFSEDLAAHGYINSNSCMVRALTSEKILLYKDIFKLIKNNPLATFLMNMPIDSAKGKPILALEACNKSLGGAFNNWINYGYSSSQHSLSGKQINTDKLNINKPGPHLPINTQIMNTVKTARVDYNGRMDCGNNHNNYNQAYYQNMRLLSLFSEKISVLTQDYTDVQLLTPVQYEQQDEVDTIVERNKYISGKYLVADKTIYVKDGSRYSEKFELIRPYVTETGKTSLL